MTRDHEVGTDADRHTETFSWDGSGDRRPAVTVVTAVAEATGRAPEDLRPLFEVIDPDALDALFERTARRSEDPAGFVAFEYEGCAVHVESVGRTVVVRRRDERP